MAARLTTHVLDTMRGHGASGLSVRLQRLSPSPADLGVQILDSGGRATLAEALGLRVYQLLFDIGAYQRELGFEQAEPLFLDQIPVRFGLSGELTHYHVPLLINPYGYSVYRGG